MKKTFTRRDTLKLTALAAGASTLGFPSLLRAQNAGTTLNVAVIGCGAQGSKRLRQAISCGCKIVALCDVDEKNIQAARKESARVTKGAAGDAPGYGDYRKLLAEVKNLDAVIIVTPDHWHYHIAKAAMLAGKHVFCEKPLTHTISQARELRELAAKSQVVTQMGNQGSASLSLRRGVDLIQAGVLGQIKEIYVWAQGTGCRPGLEVPTVADPIPEGLNWDAWLGPAPVRLYKAKYYHPWNWRGWFDFGSGPVGDFACHDLNLPVRALKLDYPTSIDIKAGLTGLPTYPKDAYIRYEFAAREHLAPVVIHWHDGGLAKSVATSPVVPAALKEYFGGNIIPQGVLILGENGFTYGSHWQGSEYIMLKDEKKLSGILKYATKDIPETQPRSPGHMEEWVAACFDRSKKAYSDFETGGKLTEIALAGALAARVGKKIEWDGANMRARNLPEAEPYIRGTYRTDWIN
jgi:predicted dehydrogenase